MTDAITIKNMHKLDISEVVGSIELPTSVYGNRSITLETLGQYLGTGGGGSGEVTKVEFDKEVTDRKAADTLIQAEIADLDTRVNTLESNPIKLKTINSESLVGTGNIKLPTQADVVSTADSKVSAYKATVDVELGTIKTNIATLDTSVSDLNTKTASLNAGQLTLTTNLAQEVTNRTSADTALGVRITNLDTKVTATDTKVQTLETETVDLDTRVTALEDTSSKGLKTINGESLVGTGDIDLPTATEVSAIASAEVETYKRVVDPKIETLEEETTDLDTRVSSLENASGLELKTINGETITGAGDIVLPTVADVEAVDDDLQAYKGVVDPQLTTLTTDLSNLNTEVDTLTTKVESQEVDITNLDARVVVLETKTHTDEHVKMTASGVAGYLADFVDGTTLVDNSGKLTVEAINGVQATKDELNYLQGATSNIQDQINDISSVGVFKGAVNNLNELYNISPAPNVGDYYIVLEDSDHGDITTIYMFSDSGFQFLGEFTAEIRDFETDPLNLETEATGVLPIAHIPTGNTDETVALGNHTHANATTTAAGFLSTQDKVKLNGIATGATKNDTDANLRDRSTHTGSQSFTTLSDVAAVEQIPVLDVNNKTSGVLQLSRLPTGTTSTTVALGSHTHNVATTTLNGFMAATDKLRLENLQGVTPVEVDGVVISDPPSQEEILKAFDYIMKNLELAGVFKYNPTEMLNTTTSLWYDPNDLTTLYQDQHGLTPVTAVGQPVGLMLDKSKGLETKVVFDLATQSFEDVFDPVTTGNTISGSTITIVSPGGAIAWFTELFGKIGRIKIKGNTNKPFRIRNGSSDHGTYEVNQIGDFDVEILSGSMFAIRESGLYFSCNEASQADPCILRFDEIVIEAINTTPAFQATSAAKPKLAYNPVTQTHYLAFDGTRSCMNVGIVDLSKTQQVTIMHAASKMSPSTAAMVFEHTASAVATGALTYGVNTATGYGESNEKTWFLSCQAGSGKEMIGSAIGYPSPDSRVTVMQWDKSKTTQEEQLQLWLNNEKQSLVFSDETLIGTGNFAKSDAYIGTRGLYGNQFMFRGEFYEFFLLGRLATEDEKTRTYSRLRKCIGV